MSLEDIPVATACVTFFQSLGGALFVTVGQSTFQNGILTSLPKYAPSVPPQAILNVGATQIRSTLAAMHQTDALPGVLQAYMVGLKHTYYVSCGTACAAFVAACFFEWKSVKKAKEAAAAKGEVLEPAIAG